MQVPSPPRAIVPTCEIQGAFLALKQPGVGIYAWWSLVTGAKGKEWRFKALCGAYLQSLQLCASHPPWGPDMNIAAQC